jgi:hypothetical protein
MDRNDTIARLQKIGAEIAQEMGYLEMVVGEDRSQGIWGERLTDYLEKKYGNCSLEIKWFKKDKPADLIYGDNIASRFSDLLTSHLTIAAELVKAALANDSNAAARYEKQWYANADEIAAFLGQINPYWSKQEWQRLLYDHLAMTKKEAVDYLTQKYTDSVTTFDKIEKEALDMAEYMSTGIVQQFPRHFVR